MPGSALVVFAKVPAAGAVKTRLAPPLSLGAAAALYEAFLGDALAAYAAPGAFGPLGGGAEPAVRLALAPSVVPLPAGLVPDRVAVHAQSGPGLGARMRRASDRAFDAGYDRVVIIGTDHPTLPLAFVGEAFRALAEPRTVALGPSDDGGYYLVGLNAPLPSLFEMAYSHPGVFEATLARAAEAGARAAVLPPWYDVDDAAGLARLVAEWRAGVAVGQRTAAALARLAETFPEIGAGTYPGAARPERAASG